MSLATFEIAAVQALLAMQGSISFSPLSEMGIAEILAAEALLHLRGTGIQHPKTPTFQETEDLGLSVRLSTVTVDESSSSMTMEEESPTTGRKRTRSCTSESSDQSVSDELLHALEPLGNTVIKIGDGNANVPVEIYTSIKWDSYTMATRNLLSAVFPRHILATHSLSGKRSPAFPDKAAKRKLDPKLVNDIVKTVAEKCGVPENVVRKAITTKCADESKMLRHRQKHKIEDDDDEE